ncbi:MAG TPA: hypothetical protein VGB81_00355 [Devosia sp.]
MKLISPEQTISRKAQSFPGTYVAQLEDVAMWTKLDLTPKATDDDLEITHADFVGYDHPQEIVADPHLTLGRKRAMLAHWLSDMNAVPGTPALRRSPCGVITEVDDLQAALNTLDQTVEPAAMALSSRSPNSMTA